MNIIGKTKKNREKTLNNFRQNQQCNLSQVGRLRGDSIFLSSNWSRTVESLLTSYDF